MTTVVITLFLMTLVGAFLCAFRFPALVIPLGIMTYAYKQVASMVVPVLQTRDTLFNYVIGCVITIIFLYRLVLKKQGFVCRTREGRALQASILLFLVLFWTSTIWSPYYGADSWKFIPYFIVYFGMLPSLMESPTSMLRAFHAIWVVTFLATLLLLVSPEFYVSPDVGRMVVHYKTGIFNEGNPLTIADMGAYLIMMSVCNLMIRSEHSSGWGIVSLLIRTISWSGILLGLWLTFNTSRGETFAGIACACLLVALVKGKNIGRQISWMVGLLSVLAISFAIVFLFLLPKRSVSELSWRYSQNAIAEGSNARIDLTTKSIEIALSSPKNFLVGIGARGCEKLLGMYPHNHFVQAFAEMGILGLGLLCASCLFTFSFGFRTLSMARRQGDTRSLVFTAFILALFIYELIVLSKKGSLTFVDTSMWLAIAVFSFDRTSVLLENAGTAEGGEGAAGELGLS